MNVQETLEVPCWRKNRNHEKATQPGVNNHVPMVLVALYRLGAGSAQSCNRYVEKFDLSEANSAARLLTRANPATPYEPANADLGHGAFSAWVDFFDEWIRQSTSMDAVLREAVPVLMSGVCTAAYHALLRLAYGLDYGSKDESRAFALAYWAVEFYPGPDFDA